VSEIEDIIARVVADGRHPDIRDAEAVIDALDAAGFVIVPKALSPRMLTQAGLMEGWGDDAISPDADQRCHVAWYAAAIEARPR
jgi:hypothetical protein